MTTKKKNHLTFNYFYYLLLLYYKYLDAKATKSFKIVIFFLLLNPVFNKLKATHALGAEMTYQCTENSNEYEINLSLFRDCDGVNVASNYTVDLVSLTGSCENLSLKLSRTETFDISRFCDGETSPCATSRDDGGIEQYDYSNTITIPIGCAYNV